MPDERRHAIERARRRGEPVSGVRNPFPSTTSSRHRRRQQVVVLGPRAGSRCAGPGRTTVRPACPRPIIRSTALGQVLEHRVVLGDLDRVVGRDQRRRGREQQALRLAAMKPSSVVGDEGNGTLWCSRGEDVEPISSALRGHGHHDPDALFLADRLTRQWVGRDVAHREDAELHAVPCSFDGDRRCGDHRSRARPPQYTQHVVRATTATVSLMGQGRAVSDEQRPGRAAMVQSTTGLTRDQAAPSDASPARSSRRDTSYDDARRLWNAHERRRRSSSGRGRLRTSRRRPGSRATTTSSWPSAPAATARPVTRAATAASSWTCRRCTACRWIRRRAPRG